MQFSIWIEGTALLLTNHWTKNNECFRQFRQNWKSGHFSEAGGSSGAWGEAERQNHRYSPCFTSSSSAHPLSKHIPGLYDHFPLIRRKTMIANVIFHNKTHTHTHTVMRKIFWKECIMDIVSIGLTIVELLCNANKNYTIFLWFLRRALSRCKFLFMQFSQAIIWHRLCLLTKGFVVNTI